MTDTSDPVATIPRRPVIPQAFAPWVNFLEQRLEVTEVTHSAGESEEMETRALTGDARREMIASGADGIACRDATIALLGERIDALKDERDHLRAALQDIVDRARQGDQVDVERIATAALDGSFTAYPDAAVTQAWLKGMSDARDTVASITVRADGIPLAVTQRMCVNTLDTVIAKARAI